MAITQNLGRNVQDNLPTVGGGAIGVGATAAIREFADVQDGQPFSLVGDDPTSTIGRLTRPSVAYGLGAGALSGILYLGGLGPNSLEDFYLAHTLTALPSGAISAALPKEATDGGSTASPQRPMRDTARQRQARQNGGSEFDPTGGTSAETMPAN